VTPWVKRLLLANLAAYLASRSWPDLYAAGALVPMQVLARPWTALTYMFLHAGLWHLLANMLGLFFFGPRLEARLGGRSFLGLYVASGLGGAALSFLFAPYAMVIGASGAVFGIMLGFALYWPTEPIYLWGLLPVQARWLVAALAVLSLWSGLAGAADGVAHFAHLGGFAAGFVYLKAYERRARRWRPTPAPSAIQRYLAELRQDAARWSAIRREELHPINRAEVERILAKVAEHGPASLTPDERAFMERMSAAQERTGS